MGGGIPEPVHVTLGARKYSQPEKVLVSSHNDPCHRAEFGLPALVEGPSLGESRCSLDPHDGTLVELLDRSGAGVGAGAAHPCHDRINEVLDTGSIGFEVEPAGTDAFLEEGSAGSLDRRFIMCRSVDDGSSRRHAEVLLVETSVGIETDVTGRFVGTSEPGTDHDVARAGGQRKCDVARMANSAIGPHVTPERSRLSGTFEYRRELRSTHTGHHSRSAHCTRANTNFDNVGSGVNEIAHAACRNDVPGAQGDTEIKFLDFTDRFDHLLLMAVRGVKDKHINACFNKQAGLGCDVAVYSYRCCNSESIVSVDSGTIER